MPGPADKTLEISRNGVILKRFIDPVHPARLHYQQSDSVTGEFISVTEGQEGYFKKLTRHKTDPNVQILTYYPTGNIAGIEYLHSESHLSLSRSVSFPIGETQVYNDKGILTKKINIDKLFRFSYQDVKNLLAEREATEIFYIEGETWNDVSAKWTLSFKSEIYGRCYIRIDAGDGHFIEDTRNMITIE